MLRLAAASTLLLCLAACSTPAAPVSSAEARHIRSVLADRAWAPVAANYPEALRPYITVHETVSDFDWPARMVTCLRGVGITARNEGGGVVYSSGGTTSVEFAVYYYSCQAAWPIQSQVTAFLKPRQELALRGYYRNIVQPCLVLVGRANTAAPSVSFLKTGADYAGFDPYAAVFESTISRHALDLVEQRCPPVPSWLNLNGAE